MLQKKISGSKKNTFLVTDRQGIQFSKISKDKNSIHTNDLVGYNSLFGKKICHGGLIFINILKKLDLSKFKSKKIVFKAPFFYNSKIFIRKKGKKIILYQDEKIKSILYIDHDEDEVFFKKKKINLKKFKFIKTKNYLKDTKNIISRGIYYISYFAGMILPGQNSIISSIKFSKLNFTKTTEIVSKRINNSPFFYNYFYMDKFLFEFETCIRPSLSFKIPQINRILKKQVQKFNKNILIVGASSGIGREVLQIFKSNKKIYIYATYNRNFIKNNQKNVFKIKINIERDLDKIIQLIKIKKINYLYYFASPKIDLNRQDNKYKDLLKNYYVNYPRKILLNNKNLRIFYPSSDFINKKYKNIYTKQKIKGEEVIKKLSKTSCILRIPEINTKNNLSFFDRKIPYFINFLNENFHARKIFFFQN